MKGAGDNGMWKINKAFLKQRTIVGILKVSAAIIFSNVREVFYRLDV